MEQGTGTAIVGDVALDQGAGGQISVGNIDEDAPIETADKIDRAAAIGSNSDVAVGAGSGCQGDGLAFDGEGTIFGQECRGSGAKDNSAVIIDDGNGVFSSGRRCRIPLEGFRI